MQISHLIGLAIAVTLLGGGLYYLSSGSTSQQGVGKPIVKISVPDLSEAAFRGKELFNANCASCHGVHAVGQEGVAPPLVHIIYEPGHHGDMSFQLAVKNGVRAHHWPFGNMPKIEGVSDNDVASIVTYVRELQRANGIF